MVLEAIFILIIAGLFFYDLKVFYQKENIKIHRILVPVGIIGALSYIYISPDSLVTATKNSLIILILSLVAFVIIVAIKLYLTRNKLDEIEFTPKVDVNVDISEAIQTLKIQNQAQFEIYKKELDSIKEGIEKQVKEENKTIDLINIDEINEIKELMQFLIKRFDEDTKLFMDESLVLKKNTKKQLEVIVKLISNQSKYVEEKIQYFQKELKIIANKEFNINDKKIDEITKSLEVLLSHIKIETKTLSTHLDEIYQKEELILDKTNTIFTELKPTQSYIDALNITLLDVKKQLDNISNIESEFIQLIVKMESLKDEFNNINLDEIKNKLNEIESKINAETKKTEVEKTTSNLAINKYKSNM